MQSDQQVIWKILFSYHFSQIAWIFLDDSNLLTMLAADMHGTNIRRVQFFGCSTCQTLDITIKFSMKNYIIFKSIISCLIFLWENQHFGINTFIDKINTLAKEISSKIDRNQHLLRPAKKYSEALKKCFKNRVWLKAGKSPSLGCPTGHFQELLRYCGLGERALGLWSAPGCEKSILKTDVRRRNKNNNDGCDTFLRGTRHVCERGSMLFWDRYDTFWDRRVGLCFSDVLDAILDMTSCYDFFSQPPGCEKLLIFFQKSKVAGDKSY